MDCSTPGFIVLHISWSLLKFMSIESVMPSNHLILCCPLLLPPSILPSIRVFSSESALRIRWPKYWNFSFNISPSNEYSGLISFRIDWFESSQSSPRDSQESSPTPQFKTSILLWSAFFAVELSHPYMTTGKTIALTGRTFVSKVVSLLLNILSRLVITFLPRSESEVAQSCLTLCDHMTVAYQAPLFMGFSRQEYCGKCSVFFTVQLSHPYMTTGKP